MPFPSLAAPGGAAVLALLAATGTAAQDPPVWTDLAIPGGAAALARAAGLHPRHPAWAVPADVVARLYAPYDPSAHGRDRERLLAHLAALRGGTGSGETDVAPLPLGEDAWRRVLIDPRDREAPLLVAILGDPSAARAYRGLLALDEQTLGFFAARPGLLRVVREHSDTFAVLADGLRVRGGALEVPGGPASHAGWAALAGESPAEAEPFLIALLTRAEGRLLAVHHALAALPEDARRAALGQGPGGRPGQAAALTALASAFGAAPAWWRSRGTRGARPEVDVGLALQATTLRELGAPVENRALFSRVLPAGSLGDALAPTPVAVAAALARAPAPGDARAALRGVALARRFLERGAEDAAALAGAAAVARERPALSLALERGGIDPEPIAAAGAAAARLDAPGMERARTVFQGALAFVLAARRNARLPPETAGRAVQDLARAAHARRPVVALAAALDGPVRGALGGRPLDGLLPPPAAEGAPATLEWEGLHYAVDLFAVERRRWEDWRSALPACALDDVVRAAAEGAAGAEEQLASALTACAYVDQGPASDTLLRVAPSLAARHQAGSGAWEVPRYVAGGAGGRVEGALLGLDLALARFIPASPFGLPGTPWLGEAERDVLAETFVLTGAPPSAAEAEAASAALSRGRQRLAGARDGASVRAAADAAGLAGWRRGVLAWAAHTGRDVSDVLTLHETYTLGGGPALAGWGASRARFCGDPALGVGRPARWDDLAGLPPDGRRVSALPDTSLAVIAALGARGLPPALARPLLPFAVRWLADEARPAHEMDGAALGRVLRDLDGEHLEDAVAALVAGPLVPVTDP